MNKAKSHIAFDDLLQAGLVGLTISADKWDERKGHAFSTYAMFWINKYVGAEFSQQHWTTVKAPSAMRDRFMGRYMDESEADTYANTFMRSSRIQEDTIKADDETLHRANEIVEVSKKAKLTLAEEFVFDMMHNPSSPASTHKMVAEHLDMKKSEVVAHEQSALNKIRKVMGIK